MGLASLVLESFLVGALILQLHRLASRGLGLAPLYVFIGSMQYLQAVLAGNMVVPLGGGLGVSPGSSVLFAASLFAILLVYLHDDMEQTRSLIVGLVVSNVALTLLSLLTRFQADLAGAWSTSALRTIGEVSPRIYLAGTLVLVVDTLLLPVTYELLRFGSGSLRFLLRLAVTLLLVLWFDALAFTSLAFGPASVTEMVPGQLAGKALAAVLYATLLGLHLTRVRRGGRPAGPAGTGITGVFELLSYRERFESVSAEKAALQAEILRREQAEAALRASESRFRALAEQAPVGVFRTDASGRCTYTNPRWQELSGLTLEQSLGEGWSTAIHPEVGHGSPQSGRGRLVRGASSTTSSASGDRTAASDGSGPAPRPWPDPTGRPRATSAPTTTSPPADRRNNWPRTCATRWYTT